MAALSLSDTSERKVSISNGGTSYARIQYGGTPGQIYCFIYVNGVKVADIRKSGLDTSVPNKVALRWSASGYSAFVNGTLIETDAFVSDFTSYPLTDLSFAGFRGKVNQILVFPSALSDTELEKLTTL